MKLLATLCFLMIVFQGFSQSDDFRTKHFNLDEGVAIRGYDPVSYFSHNKALKGKEELSYSYHGIKYNFATETNRRLFQTDPVKYEPQYGGWCAYAMGHDGSRVEIDPATFKIINGKLFLFYNRFFNNTLKSWNQDEAGLQAKADANWQKILQK
jgi:YHS domain-containing protein